jgi:hypothetical protein
LDEKRNKRRAPVTGTVSGAIFQNTALHGKQHGSVDSSHQGSDPSAGPRFSLGGRSSLRHQDLREGSALEALLFDDVQLQVLFQLGEWAVARADRNRDRRQLVFVD